jgi:hypothetical protein
MGQHADLVLLLDQLLVDLVPVELAADLLVAHGAQQLLLIGQHRQRSLQLRSARGGFGGLGLLGFDLLVEIGELGILVRGLGAHGGEGQRQVLL